MGGRGGKRGKGTVGYVPALGLGLAGGVIGAVILLAAISLAVVQLGWEWCLTEWMALLTAFFSCWLGGTVCGRLSPGRKFPMAAACGALWLLLWLGLGWLLQGRVAPNLLVSSGGAAMAGAIPAGVFAVNRKNNGK